jgi:hypothetical protein
MSDNKEVKKKRAILFPDIETSGPQKSKHAMIALGWCLGFEDGTIIDSGYLCFKMDDTQSFDKDTKSNFWDKNKELLDKFLLESKDTMSQISLFAHKLDEWDTKYDLHIVSDNPVFDVAWIDYYFDKYLDRKPLSYKLNMSNRENYRSIFDSDSYARGVLHMGYNKAKINDKIVMQKFGFNVDNQYTHRPDQDAKYLFLYHIGLINTIRTKKLFI